MVITLTNYRCFPKRVALDLSAYFTALVGVNNSGKSSLLRFVYEFRHLFGVISNQDDSLIHALRGNPQPLGAAVIDVAELFSKKSTGDLVVEIDVAGDCPSTDVPAAHVPDRLIVTVSGTSYCWTAQLATSGTMITFPGDAAVKRGVSNDVAHIIYQSNGAVFANITSLATAAATLHQSLYIGAVRNSINAGGGKHYDIDIGYEFIRQYRHWSTGSVGANRDAAIVLTELIRKQFGFSQFVISSDPDATSLIYAIDGRSYSLSEVGSGLSQFVLVLATVAVKRPKCVLIDEPELNLHPSLQRDFLVALAEFSPKVVFSTHNLGLALSDADRVYSVVRESQGSSTVQEYGQTPRLSEFLGELSYAGYRELGFESLLLVEGPTEVKVFRHFLQLYGKGHKVILVQLGGNDLINGKRKEELAEVFRICPRIAAVVDSDRTAESAPPTKPVAAFAAVCGELGINCCVLARAATENYLTSGAVKAEYGDAKTALGPFQKINEKSDWKKDCNWRIARHMTKSDLDATDLGAFLATL